MKRLAYIIGGEPRLINQSFEQNKIYKELCKQYDVDVYIHSWTQQFKWNEDNASYRFARTEGYYPSGSTIEKELQENIILEYSIYNPTDVVVEEYNEEYTQDDFPFGQYISRAKAYESALRNGVYDYVWLTRSDIAGDGPLPTFNENKIVCPETVFEEDRGLFRAEDWYYAGPTNMFKNLLAFASDPLIAIKQLDENKWISENIEKIRNTHIWQAILTGAAGEDVFQGDKITWKLLHY
jgi:hypothetical protein